MNIGKVFHIGIINTLRLNYRYFGIKGILRGYILAARGLVVRDIRGGGLFYDGTPSFACIQIGFHCAGIADGRYERSIWRNNGRIYVGGRIFLGSGTRIDNSGELHLGAGTLITANTVIECTNKIIIGENALISWDCLLMDGDLHKIYRSEDGQQINPAGEIKIGKHVWIGCRCTLLKNTTISDDAVIAAGSILARANISPNCVACSGGRVIRNQIRWEK